MTSPPGTYLEPGARLGPYQVVAMLGVGGMGEVYRARDTTLDREVAIKILPEMFAADADRVARFTREAKTLASLNHPNIAAIYGIEDQGAMRALVMELVEGEDLSALIARGPLAWPDARPIAIQIAEALEAAHEQGIVHRDLKPQNIKVKADGTVKVLDFGLAKAVDPDPSGASAMNSPTMTARETQMGMIIGTAAYMAPEQAKGRPVDRRADIWAFGVVLFEMLTGRRCFDGDDVSTTLAAVLMREPEWTALPKDTPPAIERLVHRCLERDPKMRLRDIGEARVVLSNPGAVASAAPPATKLNWWQRPVMAVSVAAMLVGLGAAAAVMLRPAATASLPTLRFDLPVDNRWPVWSDDGRQLAWIGEGAGQGRSDRIVVRRMDEFQARELDVEEGRRSALAFSPDGEWLAYTHAPVGSPTSVAEVRKVRLAGGPSQRIAAIEKNPPGSASLFSTLTWHRDRVFLVYGRRLLEMASTGGALRQVLTLPESQAFFGTLQLINDGRDLLFGATGTSVGFSLWTASMAGGEPRRVFDDEVTTFRVTPTGHLLYIGVREPHLLARRFREDTVEVIGEPVPLQEVSTRFFALSPNGMLAYQVSERSRDEAVWLDRATGRVEPSPVNANLWNIQPSADGRFLVYLDSTTTSSTPLRVWDSARQRGFLVADDARRFSIAAQTQTLFFERDTDTGAAVQSRLFRVDYPWTGAPVQVAELTDRFLDYAMPDGRRVLLTRMRPRETVVVNADGSGTPVVVETDAMPSPDGRWMVYPGGSRGQEVWVRPEPAVGDTRWLVGEGADRWPFWSSDGRELFYRDGDEQWQSVTVRGPRPDAPFELGRPVPVKRPADIWAMRAITRDGRFLAFRDLPEAPPRLAIVQNFFEELRAKVPVK